MANGMASIYLDDPRRTNAGSSKTKVEHYKNEIISRDDVAVDVDAFAASDWLMYDASVVDDRVRLMFVQLDWAPETNHGVPILQLMLDEDAMRRDVLSQLFNGYSHEASELPIISAQMLLEELEALSDEHDLILEETQPGHEYEVSFTQAR